MADRPLAHTHIIPPIQSDSGSGSRVLDVVGRLRLLSAIASVAFLAMALAGLGLARMQQESAWQLGLLGWLAMALAAVSVVVWLWSRQAPSGTRSWPVTDIYVAAVGMAVSVVEVALMDAGNQRLSGIPGLCVWITIFPLVLPMSPRRALAVGLTIAATLPLSLSLTRGWPQAIPQGLLGYLLAPSVCALVAALVARQVTGWITRLTEARNTIRELAGYRLVRRIGRGGGGEVWEARHRLLARPAAIKFFDPIDQHEEDGILLGRFEQEARVIAQLRSPHTVELYDFGATDSGRFYLVMELLDGVDFHDLVDQEGPQPVPRVVHLLGHCARSLAEAHLQGIVHRDIKPANCFCCELGTSVDVGKVLDFGLASAGMSEDGSLIHGTPQWMAPERRYGDGRIGPESDIYSLGCVAWFLLVGRPPIEGSDAEAILRAHALVQIERPSEASGRSDIPPLLEALIMACLAKDPQARPADGVAFMAALQELGVPSWEGAASTGDPIRRIASASTTSLPAPGSNGSTSFDKPTVQA